MKFGTLELAFNSKTFPYGKVVKELKKAPFNKKQGEKLVNYVISFDTETTNIILDGKKQAFLYLWGFSFNNDYYVIGRTIEEFMEFINNLIEFLGMFNLNIAIYCHNLRFDHAFIFDFIEEQYRDCKMFAIDKGDIVTYDIPHIQFRCSKKLTNLSLDEACVKYNCEVRKLNQNRNKLDLDYKTIRTPATELDYQEQNYFVHDLQAVVCLIKKLLALYDDTIKSIPLTATGYVRRVCRRACLDDDKFVYNYRRTFDLTPEVYGMLKDNKKGGNAHGNPFKFGKLLKNVKSYDKKSAYVLIMLCEYVPMSKFYKCNDFTLDEFEQMLDTRCCLFDCSFDHIELNDLDTWDCLSKSWVLNHGEAEYIRTDNGRIVEANNIKLCLNELDLKEIRRHYNIEGFNVAQLYTAQRGKLPYQLRNVIFDYYKNKEDKGIYKDTEKEYLYANSKSELLAIFGMMGTDILHDKWKLEREKGWRPEEATNSDIYYKLHDYFKTQKRCHFTFFAWSNWIVSHCRTYLEKLSTCFELEVYHDTDCCKGINPIQERIDAYNRDIWKLCEANNVTYKGKCPGLAELDAEYDEFIHFGSKSYMYKKDNKISISIAGCYKGASEQLETLEGIELPVKFKNSTVTAIHNYEPIHKIEVQGCTITTASNVYLEQTDYTLNDYNDFYAKGRIHQPIKTY